MYSLPGEYEGRTSQEMKKGPSEGQSPSGDNGRKVKHKSGYRKGERVIDTHVLMNTEKGTDQDTKKSEHLGVLTSYQYQQQMIR